jgi:uncharacterized protein (DUF885 family)
MRRRLIQLMTSLAVMCTGNMIEKAGAWESPEVVRTNTDDSSRDLEGFIRLYTADRTSVQRFHGLPWCEERLDRLTALSSAWRTSLGQLDFAGLDQHGKVDYVLLETELNAEDARVAMERRQLAEMDAALPFRRSVLDLELSRRRMDVVDAEGAAAALAKIPGQIKDVRERSRKKDESDGIKLTPVVARRTAGAADQLRRTLATWFEYHDGFKPEFAWWARKPYREAVEAMEAYAKYLREDIAGVKGRDDDPLIGDPIGAEGLASDLASELIAYTPQELIAIGEMEFAWCEAEMRRAASEMGFGDDWKAALEKVKNDHVPPGEQDALVKQQSMDAIKFVTDRDLVTVPELCMETWRLEMLSTQTQKTLPFAVYGGQYMGVAYATEEMKHDDKQMSMRGNNIHFTRIVTPHELIPGHHLQGFQAQRIRPYRSLFGTPFYVEGWAVYWEMTLWELGYPLSPENRVGMLFWRMHRCARIIVSLKFHLREMTPEEMIDFLVDRVGHERFGATSEVRRFIGGDYSPLYQCGYMIGALQLRALYKELVESGKMTAKQFNDGVLACNSVPIEAVRAELAGTEMRPGWKPAWRFGEGGE